MKDCIGLSFRSKHTFTKTIDQLPIGPEWKCELIRVQAHSELNVAKDKDGREELEL
jgi:hypothetical protein